MSNKNILITGGAGFIGSHLAERLLGDGHRVICLDNLFTGSRDNIEHLTQNPLFSFLQKDVQEPFDAKVDWIFNLACPASPIQYQREPVQTIRTNVLGMIKMLELAKETHARILQASTSEIYGDPLRHPQKESYPGNVNPISLRACYEEGKRCAETACFDYQRKYGVEVKVVRIFNTYGPRMAKDDGRVISNFIMQSLRDNEITIYGDGSHSRSFQYVDDLVEGLIRMMRRDNFTGPVNIGNPEEVSMRELAEMIKKKTGSKSKIVYLPEIKDDPRQRCPDIALARSALGWKPTVYFKELVPMMVDAEIERLKGMV